MKTIKLVIDKTETERGEVVIGDIWTRVDIQFKPVMPLSSVKEEILVNGFNARLDLLASELQVKVRDWVEQYLNQNDEEGIKD